MIPSIRNMAYGAYLTIPNLKIDKPNNVFKKINELALPLIILASAACAQGADAGLFSGLAVLAGCVGAGIAMPASLFWAAAPCGELAMIATANPLLP